MEDDNHMTGHSPSIRQVTQQNGKMVLAHMQQMDEPATLNEITQMMVERCSLPADDVRPEVRRFLRGGTAHGFVNRSGNRYELSADSDVQVAASQPRRSAHRSAVASRRAARSHGSEDDADGASGHETTETGGMQQPPKRRRRQRATSRKRSAARGAGARSRSRRGRSQSSADGSMARRQRGRRAKSKSAM